MDAILINSDTSIETIQSIKRMDFVMDFRKNGDYVDRIESLKNNSGRTTFEFYCFGGQIIRVTV